MKTGSRYISVLGIVLGIIPISSFALFDPFGPLIYGRQLVQIEKQATQAEEQYSKLKQQYTELTNIRQTSNQLVNDAEGHYGFGNLLNGSQDLSNREWSPDDWKSALQGMAGHNPARYNELLNEYKASHDTLSSDDMKKGASEEQVKVYQQQVETNRAASVNATYAFNDIKQHLDNVHSLSKQIDSAKNTKAAMDLNSRLMAEVAYIQIQELKMQAVLNQQLAQENSDKIAGETQSAKFNTLPNS